MEDRSEQVERVRQATRQMVRELDFMRGTFLQTGCSAPEIHTLLELEEGAVAVSRLAERLRQDKSTASRNVASLVRRKLVEKTADPEDGRAHLLRLTRAGRRKIAEVHRLANLQVGEALALLDDEQCRQAIAGIELYARALEQSRQLAAIEVRRIEPADDVRMADVIRAVMTEFGAVGPGYSIEDPEVDALSATYRGERSGYFVAVRDDVVLGGVGFAPLAGGPKGVCELRKMFLLPAARGFGLGRRLLETCLDGARKAGFRKCYLETLQHMEAARRLYESVGFEPLDAPMGKTGHHRCDVWAVKRL